MLVIFGFQKQYFQNNGSTRLYIKSREREQGTVFNLETGEFSTCSKTEKAVESYFFPSWSISKIYKLAANGNDSLRGEFKQGFIKVALRVSRAVWLQKCPLRDLQLYLKWTCCNLLGWLRTKGYVNWPSAKPLITPIYQLTSVHGIYIYIYI